MPIVFANPSAEGVLHAPVPTPLEFAERLADLLGADDSSGVTYRVPSLIHTAFETAQECVGERQNGSELFCASISAAFAKRAARSIDLASVATDSTTEVWMAAAALEQAADVLRHGGVRSLGVEEQVRTVVAAALRLRDRLGADASRTAKIVTDLGAELLGQSPPNSALGLLTRSASTLRVALLPAFAKSHRDLQLTVDNVGDTVRAAILAVCGWGAGAVFQVLDVIISEYWRGRGGHDVEIPARVWSLATAEADPEP